MKVVYINYSTLLKFDKVSCIICLDQLELGLYDYYVGSPQITSFFGKCFKKTTEYFLKFLFLIKSTLLPVNNGK